MSLADRSTSLSTCLGTLLAIVSFAAPAEKYTVKDLGVLGTCESTAHGMNNLGQVVGDSTAKAPSGSSLLYAFATGPNGVGIRNLGSLPGFENAQPASTARAINDAGQVVGNVGAGAGAFISAPNAGALKRLTPPIPTAPTYAWGINKAGQVVGQTGSHAYITAINGGAFTDMGAFPSPFNNNQTVAFGVNSNGQVVGSATGFCDKEKVSGYACGSFTTVSTGLKSLGLLGPETPFSRGNSQSSALGVNDKGQIVGYSDLTNFGEIHAYISDGTKLKDLTTFGGVSSQANSINSVGLVVGQYTLQGGLRRAFIWDEQKEKFDDLNNLIVKPSDWTITEAVAINNAGQIAANGDNSKDFPNCPHALLLTPVTPTPGCVDTDGDGLCDDWEINGIRDAQGKMILNLPAMGADPNHMDVFVFVDYMQEDGIFGFGGQSHKPNAEAIKLVQDAFAKIPLELLPKPGNKDNKPGITLHVEYSPTPINENGDTTIPGSAALKDFAKAFGCSPTTEGNPGGFCVSDALSRIRNARLPMTHRGAFHYALFGHQFSVRFPCDGIVYGFTGATPDLSSDFAVTLSPYIDQTEKNLKSAMDPAAKIYLEAGTFMHELGHALGLQHGGPSDDTNYKPNYLSVMNYLWQGTGLIDLKSSDPILDYSWETLPSLNEHSLDELKGITTAQISHYRNHIAKYMCPTLFPKATKKIRTVPMNEATDFNCDDHLNVPGLVTDANLNNDFNSCTGDPAQTELQGATDWSNLVLKRGSIGKLQEGTTAATTLSAMEHVFTESEIKAFAETFTSLPFWHEFSADHRFVFVGKGQTRTINFTLRNAGKEVDRYALSMQSTDSQTDFSRVPATIQLNPGQSITFPVSLKASGTGLKGIVEVSVTPVSEHRVNNLSKQTVRFHPRGDVNADGQVDKDDVNLVLSRRNTAVCLGLGDACTPGSDLSRLFDLNGDGKIDLTDTRTMVLECTHPRCAKQ